VGVTQKRKNALPWIAQYQNLPAPVLSNQIYNAPALNPELKKYQSADKRKLMKAAQLYIYSYLLCMTAPSLTAL
jgi:hypothetical protein